MHCFPERNFLLLLTMISKAQKSQKHIAGMVTNLTGKNQWFAQLVTIAGFAPIGRGTAEILNYGRVGTDKVQLLVCNYGVGRFVAQVVSARGSGFTGSIKPSGNFDNLAIR